MALVATGYIPPGTYIGQLITPTPGLVPTDRRIPCYVGRGSRLAKGSNLSIRRSFVTGETLTFSALAPYQASLTYESDGNLNNTLVKIYRSDGVIVRKDQWMFVAVTGHYTKIEINKEVYDHTLTYYIDYQSVDRDVLDNLPVDDIREVTYVADTVDNPQYQEYTHFVIVTTVGAITADSGNAHPAPTCSAIRITRFPPGASTGTAVYSPSHAPSHNYNRYYILTCTGAAGALPNRTAAFTWKAKHLSIGNAAQPDVPLLYSHAALPATTFTITEGGSLTKTIENGISLLFDWGGAGASNFAIGDTVEFENLGPGRVEADSRYSNTNQYPTLGTITAIETGAGSITHSTDSDYTGSRAVYNSLYKLEVIATGATTAEFLWSKYGDDYASGTFTADTTLPATLTQTLVPTSLKIDIAFGGGNFVVGDIFTFTAYAPKIYYEGKDDREYTVTVGTPTSAAGTGKVVGTYATDTIEGSWGSFTSEANNLDPSNPLYLNGKFTLPNDIVLSFRNLFINLDGTGNRNDAADEHTFTATCEDQIDWSLQEQRTETIATTNIYTDVTGSITGIANTPYLMIDYVPDSIISVEVSGTGTPISYTQVTDTRYLYFAVRPTTAVEVVYRYKSLEPEPGQTYYVTGNYLRPDSLYNTPILVKSRDEGRQLLAPVDSNNHLYIMDEIAWDLGVPAAYVCQVKDADGDGVYTTADYKEAILATEEPVKIKDLTVLSNFTSLADACASVTKCNDPFVKRERLLWVGCPVGTAIGSETTAGSIVYTAKRTLQVYGNSPAHGTRIIVGSTEAKKPIKFDDGSTVEITLDGSFVAGALAAMIDSNADPATTLLRKMLTAFSYVETYGELDSANNKILGGAGVIYLTDQGSSVYRIEENTTVDTFAEDFTQDLYMTQKQFVTTYMRDSTDTALISLVIPSEQAGVALIKSFVSGTLRSLLGRGLIAKYQDDSGNERAFSIDDDVLVFRDTTDKSLYHFYYAFYLKGVIKRLMGLYTVNSNDFGAGR